ncbi:MAG: polysaccharide deacetylase family protein [Intestinibacter sp.]
MKKKRLLFLCFTILLMIVLACFFLFRTTIIKDEEHIYLPSIPTANSYSFSELYQEFQSNSTMILTPEKRDNITSIYEQKEKIAYLTFDDGPTNRCTPDILDILKENHIPATFFVIGQRVEQNPELVKRAYKEGHFIVNHTYSHQDQKLYQNRESFLEEILKTDKAISNAIGIENYHSHLFRFPCGSMVNYSVKKKYISYLEEIDYTYLDWNCLNNDGVQKASSTTLLQYLKDTSRNKNTLVVLMHDSGDLNLTQNVLQSSIDYLKSEGYRFKSMKDFIF